MSNKDVLHIPTPETPHPGRTAHTENEERAPGTPPPSKEPGKTPAPHHHHHEPRIIQPQPSSNPYPGVGVS